MAVSVDGHPRHSVGTGISASDRARTARLLADVATRADDLVRPGHMVPLRALDGGSLRNAVGMETFAAVLLTVNVRHKMRASLRLTSG